MKKIPLNQRLWRQVVLDDPDLPFHSKAIALFLDTYMNDHQQIAWPSITTIRTRLSVGSNSTVIKYIKTLSDSGYLTARKRFGNSTIYSVSYPDSDPSITPPVVLHEMDHSITPHVTPVLQEVEPNSSLNRSQNSSQGKMVIPANINPDAWAEFEQHRKEIKKPLSALSRTKAMNALKDLTFAEQAQAIDNTIQNRWTGLFTEKLNGKNRQVHQPRESNFAATARKLGDKIRAGG